LVYDSADLIGKPLTMLIRTTLRKLQRGWIRRYRRQAAADHWQAPSSQYSGKMEEFPVEISSAKWTAAGHRIFTALSRDIR